MASLFKRLTSQRKQRKNNLKASPNNNNNKEEEEEEPTPFPFLTTNFGHPLFSNDTSLTSGNRGPILLQDYQLLEKLAHLNRERILERVVNTKGCGAFGYFESSMSMENYTKACLFQGQNKRTPILVRFSISGAADKGSSDFDRGFRGFAIKFYTKEGNYDLVGSNSPVFFIRDPYKFPDYVHASKRSPHSNLKDPDAMWDFFSLSPESLHAVTVLYSNRGVPKTYRNMPGYGGHTFVWVNKDGQPCFVKYHLRPESGVENHLNAFAADPDNATRDLFEHLEGETRVVAWKMCVQIMPLEDANTYRYDPFDATKVWRFADYPLIEIGRVVLDRNPKNYFAEIEQVAFSPTNLVPGIEASPDKLLQGRLFAYPDAQRHRLGANYALIPVNCPFMTGKTVNNYMRDGAMRTDGNFHSALANYSPNSRVEGEPTTKTSAAVVALGFYGESTRGSAWTISNDFEQAGFLFQLMTEQEKDCLVNNIAESLKLARKQVQIRQVELFQRAHVDYGARVKQALNL